ncbi:XF1762 family protein [Streptomyces lydicus]|uniref:XF1762 family protein n=1 Tax=Streptomyces lydicus TaxID=47763 RepID=UPI003798656A
MTLHLVPIRFRDAAAFVAMWHRHNQPPIGCKFCIGVADEDGVLRGVAIVGRPVARMFDDGITLEVNRTATDGTPNANSMLYGAAWRATKALGYSRLVTYTQAAESGASLRAAGWRTVAQRAARAGWTTPSRPRSTNGSEYMPRTLWEAAS